MMESTGRHSGRNVLLRAILPSLLIVAAVAFPVIMMLLKPGPPKRSEKDTRPLVVAAPVRAAPASFEIVTHGTVVPKREVAVAAEVAGKVVRVTEDCDAGRFVRSGTLLVEIDPTRYELEIQKLDSEVKQIEGDLLQHDLERENTERLVAIAEEDLAISQRELDRVEGLLRSNSVSASERDQASSSVMRYKTALQQLHNSQRLWNQKRDRLQAQLDLTQTRSRIAKLDLEKTKVVAPIDGFITEDLVEESSYAQPGMQLCKIEDREAIEIRCSLKLDDLYWLAGASTNGTAGPKEQDTSLYRAPRVPAVVTYRIAGKTYQWDDGFLARYEGTGVDSKTRTVPCLVEIPSPDKARSAGGLPTLVRGMFVTVKLLATPRQPLLEIPYTALRPNNEVWAVRGDQLHIARPRVAKMLDESVLLHADEGELKPGDRVVVSPLSVAIDGMSVRESTESAAPPASGAEADKSIVKPGRPSGAKSGATTEG